MVVHHYYPADPRVRRETEALLAAGWSVDVVCLRRGDEPEVEQCGGATVYRLPVRRHRGAGLGTYTVEYLAFLALASVKVARLHLRRRYHVVQAHNIPDFLVFAGALPKLLGAKVVLDVHDPVPELYMAKFEGSPGHPAVRLMALVERVSTAFADRVVTVGEPSRRSLLARGVRPEKITLVVNSADPRIFHRPAPAPAVDRPRSSFNLIYHGGLYERYGLDLAVRAAAQLREEIPELRFDVYGEGEAVPALERLVVELGVADRVTLHGFVPIERIPAIIARSDLGVVPYRRSRFTDLLYATKAFEYLEMGVPVVISRIAGMVDLFRGAPDMFVQPDDPAALAARIRELYRDRARLTRLLEASLAAYRPIRWQEQARGYVAAMERLASAGATTDARGGR